MITVNTEELNLATAPGQNIQGFFRISDGDGTRFLARAFSDHPRILIEFGEYHGPNAIVRYGIDVRGLQENDTIEGKITISHNEGEIEIPVGVEIEREEMNSSYGSINSLDALAKLAMRDFDEALRYFRSPYSERMIRENVPEHLSLFRSLHTHPMTSQKLEEFLVLTGEKRPVELSVLRSKMEFYALTDSIQESIVLRRSTWGAISLTLSTEDDFIELTKTYLTEDDFIGSVVDIPFIIRADRLGERKRVGEIHLNICGREIVITVIASRYKKKHREKEIALKEKKLEAVSLYLSFLRGKKEERDLILKIRTALSYLKNNAPSEKLKEIMLFEAWLYHETGEQKERNVLLHQMKEHDFPKEAQDLRDLYFYLAAEAGLISKERSRIAERIERDFNRNADNVILMKLYFLTDSKLMRLPMRRLDVMAKTFHNGCISPFLFEEALTILLEDESRLKSMTSFNRQVLHYAAKNGAVTEGLALRTAFLSDNEKHYSEMMYRILTHMYEKYPYDGILEAICKLLMKGPSHDSRCYKWYSLAVERNIRITRLFEYYIETIPESYQSTLPLPVRKYFIYNDTLSDKKHAFLYANITRNRLEDPETFETYRTKMELFARQSLKKGLMNPDYAALYQEFIKDCEEGNEDSMARLAHTCQVFCDNEFVRSVVVTHRDLEEEEVVPLLHGVALVHRYSGHSEILFEDSNQRRFRNGLAYSVESLMDTDSYTKTLLEGSCTLPGFLLHQISGNEISAESLWMWQYAAESEAFTESFRIQAQKKLLAYYTDHSELFEVSRAVKDLDDELYVEADKVALVETLLSQGLYDRAYHLIRIYGQEGVNDGQLIRLLSRMIEEDGNEDEDLTSLAEAAFKRGKFDERILGYLVRHYEGSFKDMEDVRMAAEQFYIDTREIDERLIYRSVTAHMISENGSKILRAYTEAGGRKNLILRYVRMICGYLFDHGEEPDEYLARCMYDFYQADEADTLMKLMLLFFASSREKVIKAHEGEIENTLEDFVRQNMIFEFFLKFPKDMIRPYRLEDKLFVETRALEGERVTLFYRIESKGAEELGDFKQEPMRHLYRNVYQKRFQLFHGESLAYYMTYIGEEEERTTDIMSKRAAITDYKGRSRYQRINAMLKMEEDGEMEELKTSLTDYLKTKDMMKTLFEPEAEI